MSASKEEGFITLILIVTILLGLGATSYLVLKPTVLTPKAFENITADNAAIFPKINESSNSSKLASASASPIASIKPSAIPTGAPITTALPKPKATQTPAPTPAPTAIPSQIPSAKTPRISLSPSFGTFNKGCSFSLNVEVDTAGRSTDGTDVVLNFDSSRFSVTSIESGTIYKDYPPTSVNNQTGKAIFSGLSELGKYFNGQGVVAKVNFSVRSNTQEGNSQIRFDFDPNNKSKTIDSNIVEQGTVIDVLDNVIDGDYIIGNGSC